MPPITIYATKAEKYARYRWGYAPRAVDAIFDRTGLGLHSSVIELGAGTGILTRSLANRVRHVVAVEPDMQMNRWITDRLPVQRGVSVIAARAEEVPLPSHFVDAILVAQAIHWFHPLPTQQEMVRLLKSQGWLVLLRNYGTDSALNEALQALNIAENGIQTHPQLSNFEPKPAAYYFGHTEYCCLTFPFAYQQDWDA